MNLYYVTFVDYNFSSKTENLYVIAVDWNEAAEKANRLHPINMRIQTITLTQEGI